MVVCNFCTQAITRIDFALTWVSFFSEK